MQFDFTNSNGLILKDFMTSDFKYMLNINSKPYNEKGAYWPLENGFIFNDPDLYDALTKDGSLKDLFVHYYNHIKPAYEKEVYNMPITISKDDINTIYVSKLNKNYEFYYR